MTKRVVSCMGGPLDGRCVAFQGKLYRHFEYPKKSTFDAMKELASGQVAMTMEPSSFHDYRVLTLRLPGGRPFDRYVHVSLDDDEALERAEAEEA
ncbi:hypothetical protein GJ654_10355 [Rhodoblastus acidophilus]|uniref:Uncharacterized protein n=1 Tax=Rhodoblastus acidophilus TaxID=1074 RepID=A0A6N8DPD1_RHOAC|nr:hypothetical protein [Rhodoblastus acidophilus]MCW2275126.1 hypothetical protein [Rhodoblastus acidophilus]MTV31395.1 hypothetical protein [Rhodoblastus acidophilus]